MNLRGNCRQPYHTVSIGWIDWSARATTTLIVVHVLADVIARVDRYHNHICVWFDVIYIFLDFSVAVAALYTFFWCGRALGDRIETRYKLKVNINTHTSPLMMSVMLVLSMGIHFWSPTNSIPSATVILHTFECKYSHMRSGWWW